ncbi:MAG: PHP domain-containing protein [Candidatus Odinarchaeota archaeon]
MSILSIFGERRVIFYDALGQIDISTEFSSKLPFLRYFIEPFYAIAYILEMEFTWMFLFLMFYPILRGLYLYLKRRGKFSSTKYRYITYPLSDIIYFCFKVLSISILIIGIYILIGYIAQGYFFVSRYFMIPVQIAVHLSLILIFIKIGLVILKLLHPKLSLNLFKKFFKTTSKKKLKRQKIKKEFVYYVGIGMILLSINIVFISTPYPTHEIIPIIPLESDEFLFDFHVHTIFSDGWLTVEERINWYLQQGISGAVFTDHDNIRGATMAINYVTEHEVDFVVFMGEEWTDNENDIHMNYYGIAEEIVPLQSYTPGGPLSLNVSDTIEYVKSHGGYIFVNHYNYAPNPKGGFGVPYTLTQLRDWGVDGFEIVNGGSYSGKYFQIRQFCLDNNLTCIGGSDIHTNEDLNTFVRVRLEDPTNLTIVNIFKTLKNNTHQVIAINLYPKVVDFPNDLNDFGFYILEDFINYLLNLDVFQSLSWILWSILGYIVLFLIYRQIKKINLRFLKSKIL